jgi:F-type H+-transporting ATPase subunit alpha
MPAKANTAAFVLAGRADWLNGYTFRLRITERGTIISIGDGIVRVKGLPSAAMDEILYFEDGSRALVFSLGKDMVGAILLEQTQTLTAGTAAYLSGRRSMPGRHRIARAAAISMCCRRPSWLANSSTPPCIPGTKLLTR